LDGAKPYKKSSSKTNTLNGTASKKVKSKRAEVSSSGDKPFFSNPLLVDNELKNWTLPRVELWCRDPNCSFNQQLWGQHLADQHNIAAAAASTITNDQVPNYHTIPAIHVHDHQGIKVAEDLPQPPYPQPRSSLTRSRLSASAEFLSSQAQVHRRSTDQYPNHTGRFNNPSASLHHIHQLHNRPDIPLFNSPQQMGLNTNQTNHHHNHLPPIHHNHHHAHAHSKVHAVGMNNLNSKKRDNGSGGGGSSGGFSYGNNRTEQNNFPNGSTSVAISSSSSVQSPLPSTQSDTMGSSTRSHNTNSTILTINSSTVSPTISVDESAASSSTDVSSGSTFVTGFESSNGSSSTKAIGHDIQDYKNVGSSGASGSANRNNGLPPMHQTVSSGAGYTNLPYSQVSSYSSNNFY
jgi:hypothetical protein